MEINGRKVYTYNRKRKPKKRKPHLMYDRDVITNDYLKYYRLVRYWVMRNYDINGPDLDCIVFLYSERLFNYAKFMEYCNILSWDRGRFGSLLEKGFIQVWRKPGWKEYRLYELTYKGKRLVNSIYKKLNGEEPIPVSRRNKVMSKNGSYADKVHAIAIVKFNAELKERQQRLVLE